MNLVGVKILVLFLLALIKLVSGLLPLAFSQALIVRKAKLFEQFVGVALCVGGGVLLATVFIHMIPETRESLDNAVAVGFLPDSHYAFAELFICLGFLLIYFIEAFVHRFFQGKAGGGHGHSHGMPRMEQHELKDNNHAVGMDNAGFVGEMDGVSTIKSQANLRGNSAK